eukprot:TRINITY_DN12424_c0_g1_i4.p2 TRINITY_DN12424_c0_g1~~TRINITY_DN12424_c0_g1_i4.p2  ORF type:complete len:101 (-),score=6.95 TRINITY_DN12424_c0_g1_i4:19-321(-)
MRTLSWKGLMHPLGEEPAVNWDRSSMIVCNVSEKSFQSWVEISSTSVVVTVGVQRRHNNGYVLGRGHWSTNFDLDAIHHCFTRIKATNVVEPRWRHTIHG